MTSGDSTVLLLSQPFKLVLFIIFKCPVRFSGAIPLTFAYKFTYSKHQNYQNILPQITHSTTTNQFFSLHLFSSLASPSLLFSLAQVFISLSSEQSVAPLFERTTAFQVKFAISSQLEQTVLSRTCVVSLAISSCHASFIYMLVNRDLLYEACLCGAA
jgi:hypothetical protein